MAALDAQPEENSHKKIEQIQSLSVIHNRKTIFKLFLILIAFAGTILFAYFFFQNGLFILFLGGFLLASWTQLAIMEELHDGYHYRLLASRRANELLTAFYASSVGISVSYGRSAHNRHHRYFGTPDDPDLPIYRTCPAGLGGWLNYIALNFSGYKAVKGLISHKGLASGGDPDWQHPIGTTLVQLALLGAGWFLLHPLAYFFFWLAPLLTLTFGIGRLRTMMDHWTPEPWVDPRVGQTFFGALYNYDGFFQRHMIGAPFGYNHHGMHHLVPSIPNYNLDHARNSDYLCPPELVRTTTYYARLREMLSSGYQQQSKEAVSR